MVSTKHGVEIKPIFDSYHYNYFFYLYFEDGDILYTHHFGIANDPYDFHYVF